MSNHLEELQAKKYQEHLLTVAPVEWQWFGNQQCFEVGDAAARPRVYFDVGEQFNCYVLSVYLEVDGNVVSSNNVHFSKQRPENCDELLNHITDMEQPPLLVVLLARLLRARGVMQTEAKPEHLKARFENRLTIWKRKLLVDLPHNVQERFEMFKVERTASRVLPKSKRG